MLRKRLSESLKKLSAQPARQETDLEILLDSPVCLPTVEYREGTQTLLLSQEPIQFRNHNRKAMPSPSWSCVKAEEEDRLVVKMAHRVGEGSIH